MNLLEAAEDSNTRVVAINDMVDTFDEGWRQSAFFATMRHESYNKDNSRRIQRSLRNRFTNGQMVHTLPAGYIKPRKKATEAECHKDPSAEPIFDEMFNRLRGRANFLANSRLVERNLVSSWHVITSEAVDGKKGGSNGLQSDPERSTRA